MESLMYGCYMVNFDYTEWFYTKAEAEAFGERSGFQWILRTTTVE